MIKAFAAAALCAAVAHAQDAVLGLVRTPAGRPLADASVRFLPDPSPDLPILQGIRAHGEEARARTDGRGQFRLPAPNAGGLLIEHESGLGAFAYPVAPGAPVRIPLQPMARVTLEGGAAFRAWPAWLGLDTRPHPLPEFEGTSLHLPPGSYEVWITVDDRIAVHRLDLLSGQERQLAAPGQGSSLILPESFRGGVWPARRPEVRLPRPTPGRVALPAAGPMPFWIHDPTDGRLHPFWQPPSPGTWTWSPEAADPPWERPVVVTDLRGRPLTNAQLWLIRDGQPLALWSGTGARAALPEDPNAVWLALSPGLAPRSGEASTAPERIALLEGWSLSVEVLTPEGAPAQGAPLWFLPETDRAARIRARTDARGRARLAHLPPGPGTLAVLDPRGLPEHLPVEQGAEPLQIRLSPGATLAGHVLGPDGAPASGVPVVLRDPTGRWPLDEQIQLTDAEGRFAFTGLPPDQPFTLRASWVRGADTLADQRVRATAEGTPWVLRLRSEDPPLPGIHRD